MAQLWILAATVMPHWLVTILFATTRRASGICFLITLSIIKWWRPTSRKKTSTGYVREDR